jgi:hypothetical protein
MSCFYEIFSNPTRKIQSNIELYIPELPKDAVNGILRSFACSFAVSSILSGGNPIAGLSGGALAALATAVHIAFMTGMKKLQAYLCHRFNKPIGPISFEGRHCAFLLSWGGILYLGNALGLAINNKASFFAAIPFILWNNTFAPARTPIMGIIVI